MRLTLNQIFEAAIDNDLCDRNPSKRTKKPQYNSKPVQPLSKTEINNLINADIPPIPRLFMLLCLFSGLRKSEALACTLGEKEEITVQEVFVNNKLKQAPKTMAGFRSIKTLPIIREAFESVPTDRIYIFSDYASLKPYQDMWKEITTAYEAHIAPVAPRHFTAHILRHTFCTLLYYADFDVLQAQYLMGHDSLEVTLKTYTHIQKTSLGKKDKYQEWKPLLRKILLSENSQNAVREISGK